MTPYSVTGLEHVFLYADVQYPKVEYVWVDATICILNPFLYALLFASLILQIRAVFAAEKLWQKIITLFLSIAALFLVGVLIAYYIQVIIFTLDGGSYVGPKPLTWLYNIGQGGVTAYVGLAM